MNMSLNSINQGDGSENCIKRDVDREEQPFGTKRIKAEESKDEQEEQGSTSIRRGFATKRPKIEDAEDEEEEGYCMSVGSRRRVKNQEHPTQIELQRKEIELYRKEIELQRKEIELQRKEIDQCRKEIEYQTKQMDQLRKKVEHHQKESEQKRKYVEHQHKVIEEQRTEIMRHCENLEQQRKESKQLKHALVARQNELEQQNKEIEQKHNEIQRQHQVISQQNKVIEEKNTKIGKLNEEKEERNKVITHQRKIDGQMKSRIEQQNKLPDQNEDFSVGSNQSEAGYEIADNNDYGNNGREQEQSSEKRTSQCNNLRVCLDILRSGILRSGYLSISDILRSGYLPPLPDISVRIEVTHSMTLQNIFDEWYTQIKMKNRTIDDGTIFFRDLSPGEFHKIFEKWDVIYSDVSNQLRKEKKGRLRQAEQANAIRELTPVDKGGSTKDFLNKFCCEIEDLVVYLPVCHDKALMTEVSTGEYMQPKCGWKVKDHDGKEGKVLKYNPTTHMAIVQFPDIEIEMHRSIFKIIGIPIRLFDEDTCLPCRDHTFQVHSAKNQYVDPSKVSKPAIEEEMHRWRGEGVTGSELFKRISHFNVERSKNFVQALTSETSKIDDQTWRAISKYDKNVVRNDLEKKVEQLMRVYYRAVGRLILHVLFDSDLLLTAKVLPKLLRNVLLRGIMPHSKEYEITDLIDDITEIGQNALFGNQSFEKKFNDFFQDMGMDFDAFVASCNDKSSYKFEVKADDRISKKNFKSFVSLYLIETRRQALDAILDGFTLDGQRNFQHLLRSRDISVINDLFFSNSSFSVEDVQALLEIDYDMGQDEMYTEMGLVPKHLEFLGQLKDALAEMSEDESFLCNFVYYMTGMNNLPNIHAKPEFRLKVGFDDLSYNALPIAFPCQNLICFPFMVYDNNYSVIKDRLATAISYARD